MTYEEAREFIHQANQYGCVPGLEIITELMNRLGNPQEQLKIIHVAGTNGKGSTCAFLTAILTAAGYRVGRYISPSVFSYRERIQISRLAQCGENKQEINRTAVSRITRESGECAASDHLWVSGRTVARSNTLITDEVETIGSTQITDKAEAMDNMRMIGETEASDSTVDMKDRNPTDTPQQRIEYITREGVVRAIEIIKPACESMVREGYSHPTYFEIETAMTFLYLLWEKVDFVVLEVGLGGRLDATNIIKKPILSVIASISMDHMQILGDTLEKIASEKAGIIKQGCPVVTCEQEPEVLRVLQAKAEEMGSVYELANSLEAEVVSYSLEGTDFRYSHGNIAAASSQPYRIRLLGRHQIKNAVLALEAARKIDQAGYGIGEEVIRKGLSIAAWNGRFEVIARKPYLVIDGAHNEDAAKTLRDSIEIYFTKKRIIYIIGVLADKDYRSILNITAPLADMIITLTPDNSRALGSDRLALEAGAYCSRVVDAGNVSRALRLAQEAAGEEDVIIAFGSLSFLGDLVSALRLRKDEDK